MEYRLTRRAVHAQAMKYGIRLQLLYAMKRLRTYTAGKRDH